MPDMNGFARIKKKLYRDDGRVLVTLSVGAGDECEEHEFLILEELFANVCEEIGSDSLDAEDVARLDQLSEVTAAFSSACASLAFGASSAKALFRKLCAKGFSRASCEYAVEICLGKGYIDEVATALRRAEIMADKPWGRTRIIAKLFEEGYSEGAMNAVRDYLEEIDFADGCMRAIEKKYRVIPTERREREKMYAALMRLGFSSADIKEALRRV